MNRSTTPIAGYGLAGISGLALILIMFLFAWYAPKGVTGINGFDAFDGLDDWVGIILVFAAFAGMALALVGPASLRVDLPVALSALTTGLGALSTLLLIIYLFATPSISLGGVESVDTSLKVGEVFGLIAGVGSRRVAGWRCRRRGHRLAPRPIACAQGPAPEPARRLPQRPVGRRHRVARLHPPVSERFRSFALRGGEVVATATAGGRRTLRTPDLLA